MRIRNRAAAAAAPTDSPSPHVWQRRRSLEKGEESEMDSPDSALETCRRNDGRRWRCKSEAVPGTSLCGHHLAQSLARKRQSSPSSGGRKGASAEKKAPKKQKGGAEEARVAEHRYEDAYYYYYYEGFGVPRVSTRRSRARGAGLKGETDGGDEEGEAEEDEMDGGHGSPIAGDESVEGESV